MTLAEAAIQDVKSAAAVVDDDGVQDGAGDEGTPVQESSASTTSSTPLKAETPVTEESATEPLDVDGNGRTPNSKPRKPELDVEHYVYRDFATVEAPTPQSLNPQSLQAQKLPAKLASMLSDPDLINMIAWAPHGRSWRVINRDLFSEIALRRFFGHKNYASFVRIVNAWGFRRITHGADRDSYYHELFLRGRPDLHQRMKRLATCHRKTPVNKDDQCPNFYELAKTSPLPEVSFQRGGQVIPNAAQIGQPAIVPGQMTQFTPMSIGVPTVTTMGQLGAGSMGNINEHVLSLFSNDVAARSMNAAIAAVGGNSVGQQSLPRVAQLQRDNEELRRRLLEMESMQAQQGVGGFGNQGRAGGQPLSLVPDQRAAFSSNMSGVVNTTAGNGGGNIILERELERMHRDFMLRSNTPMNNSLLSSFGGGAAGGGVVGSGAGEGSNFSFMAGYPRDEMLLRAMRLENQMGYLQQSSQGPSSAASPLERALQQQNNSSTNASSVLQAGDDGTKAVMDWVAKQQQQ